MKHSVQYAQNFLKSSKTLEKLVAESSIGHDDIVLDIGAGAGALTKLLAPRCKKLFAIEADRRLADKLRSDFYHNSNVEIVEADFMQLGLPAQPYKIFANIPFNRTSDIVHSLLDSTCPPEDCYLIMQREAAEKFAGTIQFHSLFSVLHTPLFVINITYVFHAHDFTPEPKVEVVLLRIQRRRPLLLPAEDYSHYADFVGYVFNHANPNILPSLQVLFEARSLDRLTQILGSKITAKPSQLTMNDWLELYKLFRTEPANQQLTRGTYQRLTREASTIEKHHRTRLSKNWRHEARDQ